MDLYAKLCKNVLFPVWETRVRRRPTLDILRELERTQHLSRDELVARQTRDLRRLLEHAAAHVPFYRKRLRDAGFAPGDLRSPEDLHALPLLSRAEARAAGDALRSTAPPFPAIAKATSGSSGDPIAFAYDLGSEHWRMATKLRGYGWAGHHPGVRTVHYWGAGAPVRRTKGAEAKIAVDRALKRETYVDCGPRSSDALAEAADVLSRLRPEVLVCFAQGGADLARHVLATGRRDWPDIRVVCGAEALLDADREAMKRAFGPEVFNSYGSREFMLMAMECEAHEGLHVSMENLVVEIVVREGERTRAARPGEVGEVVVTDLHNFGMPFVRYVNGDLAVAGHGKRCACGRGLETISSIEGRVTQTMRGARGGRVAGLAICSVVAHLGHAIQAFQAVQHESGAVTIRVVPSPAFDAQAREHLVRSLEPYFEGYPLRVETTREIPASASGKRSLVLVEEAAPASVRRSRRGLEQLEAG